MPRKDFQLGLIRFKMLCKMESQLLTRIILFSVVTPSGAGKVSLVSTTWAELAGVHD